MLDNRKKEAEVVIEYRFNPPVEVTTDRGTGSGQNYTTLKRVVHV